MPTFQEHERVVYSPGFVGTNLAEEGRELPDRLKKPVHGVVASVGVGEVYINADASQDSGWFPVP